MPGRDITFVNDGIYHIFNRTADKSGVFSDNNLSLLFLDLLKYYRSERANLRYSNYQELNLEIKKFYEEQLRIMKYFYIDLYCFSIMPTHYHLLLRQKKNSGLSHYISQIINSFTHYYNNKNNRLGPIFLSPFRAVQVRTHEQFIHVTRYIHLNHYSSGFLKDIDDLFSYPFSSLPRYVNIRKDELVEKTFLLRMFHNNPSRYREFILNNAEYQKSLERLKYTEKWK